MKRRALAVALAGVLALAGCTSGTDAVVSGGEFQLVTPGGKSEFSYPQDERQTLGEISGPVVSGDGRVAVADYPDTVVLLNFWGSWCAPCRAEADDLAQAYQQTKDLGVQFLGVNVDEPKDVAADFEASHQIPYPSIFDRAKRTLLSIRGFPVSTMPSTIVLDRQHRVAYIRLGAIADRDDLIARLTELAAEDG